MYSLQHLLRKYVKFLPVSRFTRIEVCIQSVSHEVRVIYIARGNYSCTSNGSSTRYCLTHEIQMWKWKQHSPLCEPPIGHEKNHHISQCSLIVDIGLKKQYNIGENDKHKPDYEQKEVKADKKNPNIRKTRKKYLKLTLVLLTVKRSKITLVVTEMLQK